MTYNVKTLFRLRTVNLNAETIFTWMHISIDGLYRRTAEGNLLELRWRNYAVRRTETI